MARPREFDEERVLQAALEVFRAKGFDGATLSELEQATGLGRGSLYGAFGDKRALFHKVLGRYLTSSLDERLAVLDRPGAGRAAIVALFRGIARDAGCDRERKGCLMTNCSVELADRDPELACHAARGFDRFERAFATAIRGAQARGEVAAGRDPVRLARFLTITMEGMLVLARVRPDPAWLDDAVAAVEDCLC
ncbi:MAG: TetR/AcrR family transcriptional regulator [Geminicoccaceae bacterium]